MLNYFVRYRDVIKLNLFLCEPKYDTPTLDLRALVVFKRQAQRGLK